jgi:3D-(3,5/4)-trihydroxycyclohexane-1,2-dione acylhydrolase (decyclizing)
MGRRCIGGTRVSTRTLTTAQALIAFLAAQQVERDGEQNPFFAGCFGIFGHGNLAGIGEALQQSSAMRYIPARNEQSMVHVAAGYAKAKNRLQTFACTSSVGPGATNMITAAAGATINRQPVLLLPGDTFATRRVDPVLQQLEVPYAGDVSVNDAFRPVSRYFDRINRPEQLTAAAMQAMRVLTDPAETGAVTLALPQDVQAEAWDFPEEFFEQRVWNVRRPLPDAAALQEAIQLIRSAKRPMIVAGGGVIYSGATSTLAAFVDATGIPVGETQAGKGSLRFDHPCCVGAVGATGTRAANLLAREADVVIGIGTRWSDFTTASRTAFQRPDLQFVNLNIAAFDAHKHAGLALTGDARATLEALAEALPGYRVPDDYRSRIGSLAGEWNDEVDRIYARTADEGRLSQGQVLGAVEEAAGETGVVVCAAGSMPGDLHKLWRAKHPKAYHLEYGFSCMGYELPGAMGVSLAEPDRQVFAMIGDGSWLMSPGELVTAVQEHIDLTIVLIDNHGYGSIGALSASLGSAGFGTQMSVPVDFEACARSLGAHAITVANREALMSELEMARERSGVSVVVVECTAEPRVPGYESWWDVPVAQVSTNADVNRASKESQSARELQRSYLG